MAQKERLAEILLKGAMANGYRTDLWTTQRIAEVIEKNFGIRYHRDHVGRVLGQMGWTHQKPERRAVERNEEEIERWKREEWPRIKKNATRLGAYLVFIDESGSLDPTSAQDLGTTWADPHPAPSLPPRQGLRHLWDIYQSPTASLRPLLSVPL